VFAGRLPGYPGGMSDGQDSSEPTPPGGPLRQDASGEGLDHHDTGVDRESRASHEDEHDGTIAIEDEQSRPEPEREEDEEEAENAETSLDQPSEG
jgi:hypothetical protein